MVWSVSRLLVAPKAENEWFSIGIKISSDRPNACVKLMNETNMACADNQQ